MEMGDLCSLDIEHMINSYDELIDDDTHDLDLKPPFLSDQNMISISETHLQNITYNFNSQAELMNIHPSIPIARASSSSQLISFGSSASSIFDSDKLSDDHILYNNTTDMRSMPRDPLQAQAHVVAERRRREKLTQLFIALSKILPGLKKLDKATLLGDAINYMKELQERLRVLEEAPETNTSGSNSLDPPEKNFSNTEDHNYDIGRRIRNPIQEIKVRISSCSSMLIKIQCDKEHKLVQQILEEMGKLHLTVSDLRVIPFGSNILDVTILAQIDRGFSCTPKDVTKQLEMAILKSHDKQKKKVYQLSKKF